MIRMRTAQGNVELRSLKPGTKSSLKTTVGILQYVVTHTVLGAVKKDNH